MPTFAILIILSIVFYIFYKFKYFRVKDEVSKRFYSVKSSIALGLFVIFFGLNQLIIWNDSTTSLIVGSIFIIIGLLSVFQGIRSYRFLTQHTANN